MESACRLCLESTGTLNDVLEIGDGGKLSETIEVICGIVIDVCSKVCENCLETVSKAYDLRILSKKNDIFWKQQVVGNFLVKDEENIERLLKCEDLSSNPSPKIQVDEVNSEDESVKNYGDDYEVVEVSMHPDFYSEDDNEVFKCDQCPSAKPSKEEIEHHIMNEHLTSFCPSCHKSFNSCSLLKKHINKFHPVENSLSCDQCSSLFQTRRKLEKHKLLHSMFIEEDKLDMGKCFRCTICSKTYKKLTDRMHEHINYHNRLTNSEKRQNSKNYDSLVCPHCGQIYRTKQILQQHIKRHFDTGDKYACPKCPQRFKSWGELYYHNAVHVTDRNFICEICSKSFKAKRDLRNHRIRHETKDVKKFQCSFCQLMLKSKYTLNRHILIHSGEKKHQCSYCQRAFTQKNELNKHLRVHIGENTYRCEEAGCSQAFRLLAELRLHQQIHYEQSNNDEFEN